MKTIRTYSELIRLPTFEERLRYLSMGSEVGRPTFGYDRYLNQRFYTSDEWRSIRDTVIVRDNGCDLGVDGHDVYDQILIHHMNPITKNDILTHSDMLVDPEYLICVSLSTHNAIHYGNELGSANTIVERQPNDTCPWKL